MFDLMPFNRREDNLFHYLDNLEKNFWGDLATNVSSFRTDVLDKGDRFVLEAELPGFQKEDIDIHVDGNTLTISAQHKEESEEKKDGKFVRRERSTAPLPEASTFPISTRLKSTPPMITESSR